ncbi:hypothetical protein GGS26DRAFT_475052 [Hypomontagnella submonticulosa]|nr:hypothetical protein GGS26DRAFT_475052 [Hypomontagnella submonticulosa]
MVYHFLLLPIVLALGPSGSLGVDGLVFRSGLLSWGFHGVGIWGKKKEKKVVFTTPICLYYSLLNTSSYSRL